ncbi:LOW QUALITY PROTEIN: acyl-coenzyme A oxidase-like protein [Puma concolor]|uniref:LOW QUALITY PROTEIN: acyl-coenzyme A oxidase-like protein n=1 Tax=Puma concolor TaxID=9696 RepID=A0A6P6I4I3_PUMCO|nr:LOW QUALITY PROTEIN: acyl-coenzyme A oxidase-like protein [Puma concolor]
MIAWSYEEPPLGLSWCGTLRVLVGKRLSSLRVGTGRIRFECPVFGVVQTLTESAGRKTERKDGEGASLPPAVTGRQAKDAGRYDLSLDETGALTFQRVQFVMGLPLLKRAIQEQKATRGENLAENTKNFVSRSLAIGEVLSMADMATGVKRGIIYWLFGGTVGNLGSPGHVTEWLQPLQGRKYTGMFAVTERGRGSDVRGIQTQATFDLSAQVGPHCCIVPVRDENGSLYPGVTAVDMMYKEGLCGVDNGILIFNEVRIPRENLLDKFGSVAPDGRSPSPIKNKSARFNGMLAALTPSRLAVTFQAMGATKLGLTIAIRYSHSRRQFGPKAKKEVKIIEHQTQTLRLMPHLATALALTFASRSAGGLLDKDVFRGKELVDSRPLQALVAGLKAYSTWENVSCLQDCPECTGGMVVVRELLARYTKQHQEKPLSPFFRDWAESESDKLRTSFLAFDVDTVGNLAFLLKAVNFRERALRRSLVARIHYKVTSMKEDLFSAWNSCLRHVASLSLARIQRVTLEQFWLAVRSCPEQEDQALLMKFCLLYGTKLVFQERAWYLEHKYLTPTASTRIRSQLLDLCDSVKDDALRVISAFNIPHTSLHAPIAGITNAQAAWPFYPAPPQPQAREGARSQRPKLGAKL